MQQPVPARFLQGRLKLHPVSCRVSLLLASAVLHRPDRCNLSVAWLLLHAELLGVHLLYTSLSGRLCAGVGGAGTAGGGPAAGAPDVPVRCAR